jgi:DNA topoisomerase-1
LEPISITLDQSIELIKAKLEFESKKYINEFNYDWKKIEILNWAYWAYIKYDKKNYKIPKWWKDATDLILQDCLKIIKKQ